MCIRVVIIYYIEIFKLLDMVYLYDYEYDEVFILICLRFNNFVI